MEALYLENLEELVNDDNKVVSYKLLSSVLNVHVNQAKQMLYAFLQDQRNKKDNDSLYVTYFVAGLTQPENGVQVHKCAIVPEESLSSYKTSLAVVTSSHIYSIQKSRVKDANVLYSADYESTKQNMFDTNKYSAIRHTDITVKSEADRKRPPPPQKSEDNSSTKKTNGNADTKPSSVMSGKPAAKKGGIAGMFAHQAEKKPPEKVVPKEEKKEDKKSHNESKTAKKGVMNFFANHTGKKSEPKPVEKITESVKTEKVKEEPPQQQKDKARGKKTGRGDEKDTEDRKRKRRRIVQEASDSSSEEEMEYESPIPSPVREPSPPPPAEKEQSPSPESPIPKEVTESRSERDNTAKTSERHRKRKRKLVPKTFMDDEGYMVTEKVWESESTDASDADPAPPPKKVAPPPQKTSPSKKKTSPKKKSPPSSGNRKQMALTSFFTKK